MTVYTMTGAIREHPGCYSHLSRDGMLQIFKPRPICAAADLVASYPITSVEHWEP